MTNTLTPEEQTLLAEHRRRAMLASAQTRGREPSRRLRLRIVRTPVVECADHERAVNAILEPMTEPGAMAMPPRIEVVDGCLLTVIWALEPVEIRA